MQSLNNYWPQVNNKVILKSVRLMNPRHTLVKRKVERTLNLSPTHPSFATFINSFSDRWVLYIFNLTRFQTTRIIFCYAFALAEFQSAYARAGEFLITRADF